MEENKKKVGLWTVIFLIVLAAILAILSIFFNPVNNFIKDPPPITEKNYVYIQEEDPDTIDVMVFGDSLTYTSYNPIQVWNDSGITSYVCGSHGADPITMFYLFRKALKTQHPKVVMIETDAIKNSNGIGTALNILIRKTAGEIFPVIHFHNMWKNYVKDSIDEDAPAFKGFEIRTNIQAYSDGEYMVDDDKDMKIDVIDCLFMRLLKRLCDKNGVQLILYSSISPKNYSNTTHYQLQQLADNLGISYLDMNMDQANVGIDWNHDSLDGGDHVNYFGSVHTTTYLENYLMQNFELEDHRGDVKYSSYDTATEEFWAWAVQLGV